ncbi:MAG: hypothetical protein ACI9QN_000648 [Arcticibacterium sp.]|jgi:hypothetical protein
MTKSFKIASSILLFCSLLAVGSLRAQGLFSRENVLNQYTTVGLGLGSAHYYGDIASIRNFQIGLYTNVRWNIGANYTRYITSNAALRLQVSWIRILGDDFTYSSKVIDKSAGTRALRNPSLWRPYLRNLHFRNDMYEATLSGVWNLLPTYGKGGANKRLDFTPYFTAGVGLVAHSPKAVAPAILGTRNTRWEPLQQAGTSGQNIGLGNVYSKVAAVIPVGLGIRIKVNNKIDITFEGNLRISGSDYLDDVGRTNYPNEGALTTGGYPNDFAFSYRQTEVIQARTNDRSDPIYNRAQLSQIIYSNKTGSLAGANVFDDIKNILYKPTDSNIYRGGTNRTDFYATTMFTISYVISDKIKCPVPR